MVCSGGTKGAKPVVSTTKYFGRQVSINQEVKVTDSNISWYHIHQNGESIGWIESTSIKDFYQLEDYAPTVDALLKTDDNNRLVINMDIDTSELHKTKLVKADTKEKTAFNLPLLNVQSIIW